MDRQTVDRQTVDRWLAECNYIHWDNPLEVRNMTPRLQAAAQGEGNTRKMW